MPLIKPTPLSKALLRWFAKHGRHDLPWQKQVTPYRVWVSEIMLQQTQVATVIPYFLRFMQRFPNLHALANADIDEVLHYWSGLGYYARGRYLHETAQYIAQQYRGCFPKTLEALSELRGIGRSTAGAILSFSMNVRAVILDGNVKRVLARYHALEKPIDQPETIRRLWELAEQHTPQKAFKSYNQGIMDIGALICARKNPRCDICPLQNKCEAYISGAPEAFPIKTLKQTQRPHKTTYMLLLLNEQGHILLKKRAPTGVWAKLWSFPEYTSQHAIKDSVLQEWEIYTDELISWPPIRHQFTHFSLSIYPVIIKTRLKSAVLMDDDQYFWYDKKLPLPGGIPTPVSCLLKKLIDEKFI